MDYGGKKYGGSVSVTVWSVTGAFAIPKYSGDLSNLFCQEEFVYLGLLDKFTLHTAKLMNLRRLYRNINLK